MHRTIIIALLGAAILLPSSHTQACGGPIVLSSAQAFRLLEQAEAHLDAGRYRKAINRALLVESNASPQPTRFFRREQVWAEAQRQKLIPLIPRARRIKAVATIRLEGNASWYIPAPPASGARDRNKKLRASVDILQRQLDANPDDPRLQTRLAEGLAAFPESQSKALQMLETLEARDLIIDAHGYKVLASLTQGTASDAALKRCRAMAHHATTCPPNPDKDPSVASK